MTTVQAPLLDDPSPNRSTSLGSGTSIGLRRGAPLVGAAVAFTAFGLYLAYIARFGVNVPHWDDWTSASLLAAFQHGSLHFSQLWAQHNEHRMLVPNVLAVVVGDLSHFDVKVEMYLGACFLGLFVVALIATMRSVAPRRWGEYAPIAVVMFMPVQWENAIWGFQFAQFLVLALLAGAAYALCRIRSRWGIAVAIALATAASFSCLQGLFVWPAVAILLWSGGRSRSAKVVWFATAALVWCVYFWNFSWTRGSGGPSFALSHPVQDVKLLLTALGGFALGWGGLAVAQIFGLGMLLLGVAVLIRFVRSKRTLVEAVPAVLVAYALLFDLALVLGRGGFGAGPALESRYVTYNLLILVAAYLAVLEPRPWRAPRESAQRRAIRSFLPVGATALTVILLAVSATRAISDGRAEAVQRKAGERVLVNYRASSDGLLLQYLTFPAAGNAWQVREFAAFLEQKHDSVFASESLVASLRIDTSSRSPDQFLPARDLLPRSGAVEEATAGSLRLREAWAVLSTVYRGRADLQRSYPETSPDVDRDVLGWAVQYGATIDADMIYLRPELSSLKELLQIAGHLPTSRAVARELATSPRLQRTWAILSAEYDGRVDLQAQYPKTSRDFDREILGWAIRYGVTIDYARTALRPELASLKQLARAASSPR